MCVYIYTYIYVTTWLDGRKSEWTPGVGDGQGGLACCDHGVAKSQTRLSDWTELIAETPVLWPPRAKSWLIGKDSDAGRDWGQEEKGTTEDEMAGWHHRLNGRDSEWNPGVGDGQGGLAYCDSWVAKSPTWVRDWTELNWRYFQESILWVQFLYLLRSRKALKSFMVTAFLHD